jgi:hypothetical protein
MTGQNLGVSDKGRYGRAFWLCWVLALSVCTVAARADAGVVLTNVTAHPDGGLHLQAMGPRGMVYSLQLSSNLRDWRTLDFAESDSGSAVFEDNATAVGPRTRFYRVRVESPRSEARWDTYRGWSNSIVISNGVAEAAVVPAIGRIMQFRFLDQPDGPFWENPVLFGKKPAANSWDTPGSFGGDKVWPAPQSAWNWPPPRGFDSLSFTGAIASGVAMLTGPVDSTYGTRVVRRITLHPSEPILRVTSTLEKMTGKTNQMGVWVITQVKEAERVFVPVPSVSLFAKGYTALGSVPQGLVVTNGFISLSRDRSTGTKIGNDAGTLLWVGTNTVLLLESPRMPGVPKSGYPDSGCSAEVYTNPNPTPYIELELLGPLARPGTHDSLSAVSIYSLFRRTGGSPLEEAKKILE